jgi:hypothetical protein
LTCEMGSNSKKKIGVATNKSGACPKCTTMGSSNVCRRLVCIGGTDNTFEPIFNIIYSWLPQSVVIFNQMRNLFLENILFFFFFHIQDYCFIGDVLAMFFFYAMAIFFILKIVFFHQFFFILAELFFHIWWRLLISSSYGVYEMLISFSWSLEFFPSFSTTRFDSEKSCSVS